MKCAQFIETVVKSMQFPAKSHRKWIRRIKSLFTDMVYYELNPMNDLYDSNPPLQIGHITSWNCAIFLENMIHLAVLCALFECKSTINPCSTRNRNGFSLFIINL